MRYVCVVEYDGSPFNGWQRQSGAPSVQEAIENAVRRFCGADVRAFASGRTDAGVHAEGQVFHVDLPREYAEETVRDALNAHLRPHPVAILSARKISDDFHARFSCTKRIYRYDMFCRRAGAPLLRGRAWELHVPLCVNAMRDAAAVLTGRHDFTSFRDSECQAKSPVKTLTSLRVETEGRGGGAFVRFQVEAPSFLHHMVRIIVGSLTEIGRGARNVAWITDVLAAKKRAAAGPTAPACGLYFVRAEYEEREIFRDAP
ncbi:MAG: tRNA pseudouridine(38-40) synthase TruA [Rickettsiales bacterium]